MVTILTSNDCIHFNLNDYDKEKRFCDIIRYHKHNTDKNIRLKSPQFSNGVIMITPKEVMEITQEDRKYNVNDGKQIEELILGLG